MADIKKYRINRVTNADGTLEVVHPETDAEQVLYSATIGTKAVTTVDQALGELATLAQSSGVTGVKGEAESTYRKGNVSLSPANIGAVKANTEITAGAATKITYDSKGLVTKGEQAGIADISGLSAELAKYVPLTQKGANNGVASLDGTGKVPTSQLPSYVDDVVEYNSKSNFPSTGETGKIYIAKDTNLTYRWSGTAYVEISPSLALGETSSTAYAGDKGKANADNITTLQGQMSDVLDGTTKVPSAENADKLGGVVARDYALKTDIPEDELYFVTATVDGLTMTLQVSGAQICDQFNNGKVPIIRASYSSGGISWFYLYGYSLGQQSLIFASDSLNTYSQVEIPNSSLQTVTMTVTNRLNDVDNGGGSVGFVTSVTKNGSTIKVDSRRITNSDLPTSGVTAGSYTAVTVNDKGIVTNGGSSIEWGTTPSQTSPSDNLMVGGLFFQLLS